MFDVILSPEAQEFFQAAEPSLAKKLARCFAQLEHDPRRHNNIKRLTGTLIGKSRYRVGDWRVIYRIDDGASQVLVLSIANRREVYE